MSGFGFDPFGAAPFAAVDDEGVTFMVDSLRLWTPMDVRAYTAMLDAILMGDAVSGADIVRLFDRLSLGGGMMPQLTALGAAADVLGLTDEVSVVWSLTLADSIVLAEAPADKLILTSVAQDVLLALGLATGRLHALGMLSVALAINDAVQHGFIERLSDGVVFGEAVLSQMQMLGALADTVALDTDATNTVRLVAISRDTLELPDSAAGTLQMMATARDGLVMYVTLTVGGNEIAGWVWNTTNMAASEYTNWPFESLENAFGGRTFAAGAGGIFELSGTDDAGEDIAAELITALMDFGIGQQKRLPGVYYAYTGAGDLVFKVVTTSDTGSKIEDWYRTDHAAATDLCEGRETFGRGLKSRYWQLRLCNTQGEDFDFGDLQLLPLILDKRI